MKNKLSKLTLAILVCISTNLFAQMKFNSAGNLETNLGDIYFKNSSGSQYGIGYGARGASQMVLFSDNFIDFYESDGNRLQARFSLNDPYFWFDGKVEIKHDAVFNKDHWTGGLRTTGVIIDGQNMPVLYPVSDWYGSLGFWGKSFGRAYIKDIWNENLQAWSDRRLKENIKDLDSTLKIVKKLKPVKFDYKDKVNDTLFHNGEQVKVKGSKNRYGFVAQDVMTVLPDVVSQEPESGYYSITMLDFIPLLVKAIQEQQAQIELLEKEVKQCCKKSGDVQDSKSMLKSEAVEETTSVKSTSNKAIVTGYGVQEDDASLAQNNPNPFDQTTTIEMTIPETVADATVYVYDLNGTQKLSIPVHMRGATNVTVSANELEPGMYIYSLVTDGVLVGSKQMILTE